MESEVFLGMQGLTLEAMKQVVVMGRWNGKLSLQRYGERWAMLFLSHKQQGGNTYYLIGEKSRRPRLFANADTAIRIAATMGIPELRVSFTPLLQTTATTRLFR